MAAAAVAAAARAGGKREGDRERGEKPRGRCPRPGTPLRDSLRGEVQCAVSSTRTSVGAPAQALRHPDGSRSRRERRRQGINTRSVRVRHAHNCAWVPTSPVSGKKGYGFPEIMRK